jgi:hypothetical protein
LRQAKPGCCSTRTWCSTLFWIEPKRPALLACGPPSRIRRRCPPPCPSTCSRNPPLHVTGQLGQSHCMRGDQDIELPQGCSSSGQHATGASELRCRGFVERHDFDGRRERVDEAMQFPRSLSVSSVAKFGERDRTDAEVRRRHARMRAPTSPCPRRAKLTLSVSRMYFTMARRDSRPVKPDRLPTRLARPSRTLLCPKLHIG